MFFPFSIFSPSCPHDIFYEPPLGEVAAPIRGLAREVAKKFHGTVHA